MFSKHKRPIEETANGSLNKKPKLNNIYFVNNVRWKTWLLQNFEFKSGCSTAIAAIIDSSSCPEEKENFNETKITTETLGRLVKQVWKGMVKRSRKGPRGKQEVHYLNLARKAKSTTTVEDRDHTSENQPISSETVGFRSINVPNNWSCYNDREGELSFLRVESFQANNHRAVLEVLIRIQAGVIQNCTVRANGSYIDLKLEYFGLITDALSLVEQIEHILVTVDNSEICKGYTLSPGENVIAMVPHHVQIVRDLTKTDGSNEITSAFSDNCTVLLTTTTSTEKLHRCANCTLLKHRNDKRTKRKCSQQMVHPNCNKRFLDRNEIEEQLDKARREKKLALKRVEYWKNKFQEQVIEMEREDHKDLESIFEGIDDASIPEEMKILWSQQRSILNTKSHFGYRWHPKVMKLCLELYCKNPHVLDPLRKFIKLPSTRTIRLYKNKVEQTPGWNDNLIRWCLEEAKKKGLKETDYWGGLILDEMKIQENLEMVMQNGKHKLMGFVDLGKSHDIMAHLTGDKTEPELATHVLQFIFLSDNGFRFPIAQFPSGSCTPSDLYFVFWEGVMKMLEEGIMIYWCILDGADVNRLFIKIHFQDTDPVDEMFMTRNIFTDGPMIFIMDPKHNIKKIRNNLTKSNSTSKPRCLTIGGKTITWKQMKDAYSWDQTSFSLPLHERLTENHFDLDPAAKMRNHLAEDVLDRKMLFLMKKFKEDLEIKGKDGSVLDATVCLLQHTSNLVQIFNDKEPISSTNDRRLIQLQSFHSYLSNWRAETVNNNAHFVSSKLWFDLQSMLLGFRSMVCYKLKKFPMAVIKPAIINQDCVENHFCQVRACNGQNNNPTFRQQESTQNSIRCGQTTISFKSNAGMTKDEKQQLSSCTMPDHGTKK